MIVRGFNSEGILEAVQNAEDICEKIENPFREQFFILAKLLVFFFKISLFSSAFKSNTNKHCKFLNRKFITYLLNKFYEWPVILVGLEFSSALKFCRPKFCHLRKNSSLRTDFVWLMRYNMLNSTSISTLLILILRETNSMSNLSLSIFIVIVFNSFITIFKERALFHVWKSILRLFQLKNMFTCFETCTLPTQHFLHFFYDKLTNGIELKVPSKLSNFHFLLTLSFSVNVCNSQEFPQINTCICL